MIRLPDWPQRLADHFAAASGRLFSWGGHDGGQDCCLAACDAVLAMTGTDPAEGLRGTYHDRRSAYAVMGEYSGGGVAATAAKIAHAHGAAPVLPMQAQRGDVVLIKTGRWWALGTCNGATVGVATQPAGLAWLPLSSAARAWHV
jgi:hypothetical protein